MQPRFTLCASLGACAAMAACAPPTQLSHLQYAPSASVVRDRKAAPLSYSVLYSFGEPLQGSEPFAGLLDVGGTLYGTTFYGGKYCVGGGGCGTIFSITTSGTEKVLHNFGSGSDGKDPAARLIDVGGTLYGTTLYGGKHCAPSGCGTVFSISTKGTEKVLYSFGGHSDGKYPDAGLTNVGGTLYGTTQSGGKYCAGSDGCGTVYRVTTSGKEHVVWSFGNGTDGAHPGAALIDVSGTLYGTTLNGGKYCVGSSLCGTVYSITMRGSEKVLHSFGSGRDGSNPGADLIDVGGTLYSTTAYGGNYCGTDGCGTVFSITTSGAETVLYSFRGSPNDGAVPVAALIDVNGTLYGTTEEGGGHDDGTVFSVPKFGTERVLHSFGNGSAGAQHPLAELIDVKGTLYSTTELGGQFGVGTVFTQSPL